MEKQNNKIVALSHSAFKCFNSCPRQFYLRFVERSLPFVASPAIEVGNRVHKEIEVRLKNGTKLEGLAAAAEPYCEIADRIRASRGKGRVFVEKAMAISKSREKCSYWSEDVWIRAKLDLMIIDKDNHAFVFDWKTGSKWDDHEQLKLYAALVMSHYKNVESVTCAFVWLKSGTTTAATYNRNNIGDLFEFASETTEKIRISERDGSWETNPGFACRFCTATIEQCEDKIE